MNKESQPLFTRNFMKLNAALILACFLLISNAQLCAQKQIGFGIHADPVISWFSSDNSSVKNDGTRPGLNFGLTVRKYFAANYAFTGGISLINAGGRISYGDTIRMVFTNSRYSHVTVAPGKSVVYHLRYLAFQAGLRLQTNEIGRIRFFTDIGLDPKVAIWARADIPSLGIKGGKPVNDINLLNLSYYVSGGIEYTLEGDTALVFGLNFDNNFLDSTNNDSNRPDDILSHKILSFRIGLNF